jgi:thioredoxin reductase (NADPH)
MRLQSRVLDRAKSVVIATGSKYKKLGIPGEEEFGGQGVSYCAVCDGAFFKNKKVYVIGGGDSAVEEAIYLSNLSSEVNIIHRRNKLRAQKVIQERAFNNKKINFVWNTVVESIIGDETKVTNLKLKNVVSNEENIVNADGVFIYIGEQPITSPFINLGITNSNGWIITDNNMHTSVPGIFAVGDVRDKNLRQIITATNDGGIAGQQVFQYLESLK